MTQDAELLIPTYEGDYFQVVNGATEVASTTHKVEIFKIDRFGGRKKVMEIYDAGGYLKVEEIL